MPESQICTLQQDATMYTYYCHVLHQPTPSDTVEQQHNDLQDILRQGHPCVPTCIEEEFPFILTYINWLLLTKTT
jgi:hypothetical protein